MKKLKLLAVFAIFVFSSLFYVNGIYGYLSMITVAETNLLSINDKTSYTVIHEKMNLDGTTYTEHSSQTFTDILIGTQVSPTVLSFTGYDSPNQQTVTLTTFNNTVIRYQYPRHRYNLTINNSNYVTTSTPTGSYLYGTQIHLVADATDGTGNQFIKWSNNETNRDYTFTLTSDVTISPLYEQSYQITYVPNNGDPSTTGAVAVGQHIGAFPAVTNETCVGTQGDYHARGCTAVYELEGWYLESDFQTKIDEGYIPTGNTTVYAKWNRVYFANDGPVTFDGTSLIDTYMQLFNEENADRDFLVTVTVDSNNGYVEERGSIFANMKENGEPYPGAQFFYDNTGYVMNVNAQGHKMKTPISFNTGSNIAIKRENGVVSYSIDGDPFIVFNDISSFNQYFDINATFGGQYDKNGNQYRYFKGTLSDMSVQLFPPDTYTIHFDANGGTGAMADQSVRLNKTVNLHSNAFSNGTSVFTGWNTAADGSGTSYTNGQSISQLGNKDDVITLYAQWLQTVNYSVHFDANGGTGTMADQQFTYNDPAVPLTQNAFTKTGYVFVGWNTAADGSGTSYEDEEAVRNLSNVNNSVVTLYAQYMRIAYSHAGSYVFNGTSDFIDTGINLYSQTNIDKDFEIRFTVDAVAPDVLNQTQPTIISCKDESNPKWPGFNVRFNGNATQMVPAYKWNNNSGSTNLSSISTSHLPVEFVFKREDKIVYFSYSYNGYESTVLKLFDQRDWQLNQYFTDNVSFGGIYNSNHNPDRFFKGTLSNMLILIKD